MSVLLSTAVSQWLVARKSKNTTSFPLFASLIFASVASVASLTVCCLKTPSCWSRCRLSAVVCCVRGKAAAASKAFYNLPSFPNTVQCLPADTASGSKPQMQPIWLLGNLIWKHSNWAKSFKFDHFASKLSIFLPPPPRLPVTIASGPHCLAQGGPLRS